MRRQAIALSMVVLIGVISILGSAAKQPEPVRVLSFDYSPPSNALPNSAKVTFALVNAHYSQNEAWTQVMPFTVFSQNLASDFQEILAAKGFTVRGPFGSYDEMTFPDKKNSDLILQPDLDVRVDGNPRVVPVLFGKQVAGDLLVHGHVNLSLRESLTGERMWYKSIALPSQSVSCKGNFYTSEQQVPASEATSSALLGNPDCAKLVGPILESYYGAVMDKSWNYMDPDEMAMVKKQSEEIRTRKVY